jgi:peptidoglycan hydrolase-like protein with peptidoglycan-binding domain
VGRPEASRLVLAGQKALARLNYITSKPDGLLGPETRQAVERFEQDHRLPVTGEFNPRTARELAVHSGLPVE